MVAILRTLIDTGLFEACRAMVQGGLRVAEVPLTTPGALELVSRVRQELDGQLLMGTGSVLDAEGVRQSVDAGAQFIVSPILKAEIIETSHALGVPCMPGALTPTEIQTAWELGADIVKVFPAHRAGGPGYIREILAPLPHLKLMPTGGVSIDTAREWLEAGAVSLGVGTSLFRPDLIKAEDWKSLAESVRGFVDLVNQTRRASR
ncbi:MAG: bifunctional 4-hydroxy-2-oxoglutarate aldolase/2-dehydro-3-deoxy-phosphogluconate aldolase [Phycisphaeraceae bacterium]